MAGPAGFAPASFRFEGGRSSVELRALCFRKLVGLVRLALTTFRFRGGRSSFELQASCICLEIGGPGEIRTHNLPIQNRMLSS